jgi:hydroxymethylpyrimidine/phosphomethylpyrimidine kinase
VRTVARTLLAQRRAPHPLPPIVIDPVCVSTSGYTLLEHDAIAVLVDELLPLAAVLTPNIDEAMLLLQHLKPQHQEPSRSISSIGDMLRTACDLRCALGAGAVLLKGGHLPRGSVCLADVVSASVESAASAAAVRVRGVECEGMVPCPDADAEILLHAAMGNPRASSQAPVDGPVVVDVLYEQEEGVDVCTLFVRPYLDSNSTHGTGCTLSAALACALARGEPRACTALSFLWY